MPLNHHRISSISLPEGTNYVWRKSSTDHARSARSLPGEPLGAGGSCPVVPELNKTHGKIRDSSDSSTQNGRSITGVLLFHWQNSGKTRCFGLTPLYAEGGTLFPKSKRPPSKPICQQLFFRKPSWEVLEKIWKTFYPPISLVIFHNKSEGRKGFNVTQPAKSTAKTQPNAELHGPTHHRVRNRRWRVSWASRQARQAHRAAAMALKLHSRCGGASHMLG